MRQNLLWGISAVSGLAALAGCGQEGGKKPVADLSRPNVIFIYSDN